MDGRPPTAGRASSRERHPRPETSRGCPALVFGLHRTESRKQRRPSHQVSPPPVRPTASGHDRVSLHEQGRPPKVQDAARNDEQNFASNGGHGLVHGAEGVSETGSHLGRGMDPEPDLFGDQDGGFRCGSAGLGQARRCPRRNRGWLPPKYPRRRPERSLRCPPTQPPSPPRPRPCATPVAGGAGGPLSVPARSASG